MLVGVEGGEGEGVEVLWCVLCGTSLSQGGGVKGGVGDGDLRVCSGGGA